MRDPQWERACNILGSAETHGSPRGRRSFGPLGLRKTVGRKRQAAGMRQASAARMARPPAQVLSKGSARG